MGPFDCSLLTLTIAWSRRLLPAARPDQTASVRLLVFQSTVREHAMPHLKAFDPARIAYVDVPSHELDAA